MNNKEKKTHSMKARGMISDVVVHVVLALLAIVWVIPGLLTSGLDGRPSSSLHCLPRVHHPHAADANAPVCAAGATTPEPDPGVGGREEWSGSARRADRREIVVCGRGECVGGRGEGLDSPGGRIGVSLLTGAKFGDRMKKIFSEFFVLDFMRTEKFREDIV